MFFAYVVFSIDSECNEQGIVNPLFQTYHRLLVLTKFYIKSIKKRDSLLKGVIMSLKPKGVAIIIIIAASVVFNFLALIYFWKAFLISVFVITGIALIADYFRKISDQSLRL